MQELLVSVWRKTGKQIFFITHSIEEALFLGTKVIVMSPRPGRIVSSHDLNFVDQFINGSSIKDIKRNNTFNELREDIRELIHRTQNCHEETA
jgi:taurine transport system ATP-binding protein